MEQRKHILFSEVEGKQVVCFDTGLEPRSFARTKMSQSLIERGYIVYPNGSHEVWISSGVCEYNNHMRVWGPLPPSFISSCKRFDQLLNQTDASNEKQLKTAVNAIAYWLKAKISLGDIYTTLNPAATFISSDGSIFFAPPNLANRCLIVEGLELDFYNCPDLMNINAAAFSGAAMLYKILTNKLPYSKKETLYQDMREGVLLPVHLAAPNLNKKLCELIQAALYLPVVKGKTSYKYNKNALDIINKILHLLSGSPSLFNELSKEENKKIAMERKSYLFKQKFAVNTRRFAVRNKFAIMGVSIALFFVLFILFSMYDGMQQRPTTEGMLSSSVIQTYYNAYSSLDHVLMEVCTQGSDSTIKNDINAATTLYAVAKTRQSYDLTGAMPIISARAWQEAGRELPAPDVFGITDLDLVMLSGSESGNVIAYRANYNFWDHQGGHARQRTDTIALQRDRRGNWRITEIIRIER